MVGSLSTALHRSEALPRKFPVGGGGLLVRTQQQSRVEDEDISSASTTPESSMHAGHIPAEDVGGAAQLRWPYSEDVFDLGTGDQCDFASGSHLPVLGGRLFLASMRTCPVAKPLEYYLTLNKKLRYIPFCADFGPFNLGTTHHVCTILKNLLKNSEYQDTKIIYYTSAEPADITNAMYLLGAFLCIHLDATPEQAWRPFQKLHANLSQPYRDATWVKSTFDLHLMDCWAGIRRAMQCNLYEAGQFDKNEYFYYDDPNNGDLHEVMRGKFIAFKGPRSKRIELVNGSFTMLPSDYVQVFKAKNVTSVVRLNNAEYDAAEFEEAGLQHHDLFFTDCSTPADDIVERFLQISENTNGIVSVHCLAGLGRTGTLIGLYMMKHCAFTAREAIAWLRISRPGCIIGPQQAYLAQEEERMQMLGQEGIVGLGNTFRATAAFGGRDSPKSQALARESAAALCTANKKSGVLADMVTDGMMNRDRVRLIGNGAKAASFAQEAAAGQMHMKPSLPKASSVGANGRARRKSITLSIGVTDSEMRAASANCSNLSSASPMSTPATTSKVSGSKGLVPGKSGGFAARIKSLAGGIRESVTGAKKPSQQAGEGGGLSNLQRTGTY